MHATRKVKVKDISPNLTCRLCQGYFIDATTIVECLHSFCRSCIVRHLDRYDFCPVCEVQLHSSKPLSSIRSDTMLQEIVYKLVPKLFQNEMTKRREFYKEHPETKPRNQQDGGRVFNESYITSDDIIHLSLEFDTPEKELREKTKRFFQCPAAVSISILKKLIQGKYGLSNRDSSCIQIMYKGKYLPEDFLLMDIAYKYSWSQNGNEPLQLTYRFLRVPDSPPPSHRDRSSHDHSLFENGHNIVQEYPEIRIPEQPSTKHKSKSGKISASPSIPKPVVKRRGRPKRTLEVSSDEVVPVSKKPKITEQKKKSPKKSKISKDLMEISSHVESDHHETEVQLRISENGIMRATSFASGEEHVITPLSPPKGSSPIVINDTATTTGQVLTNGVRPSDPNPFHFIDLPDQTLPLSTTKQVENGIHDHTKHKQRESSGLDKDDGKTDSVETEKDRHLLKVPSPAKLLHSSTFRKSHSPSKPKLTAMEGVPGNGNGIRTPRDKVFSPKKPPKFFKSRISENTATLNGISDNTCDTESGRVQAHFNGTSPSSPKTTASVGGKEAEKSAEENEELNQPKESDPNQTEGNVKSISELETNSNSDTTDILRPATPTDHVYSRHQPEHQITSGSKPNAEMYPESLRMFQSAHLPNFPYPLQFDANMNMGLAMSYIPALSMFCQPPFLRSTDLTLDPTLAAFAATMGYNPNNVTAPMSFFWGQQPISSPQKMSSTSATASQNNNSMDLSMPKKSKSTFILPGSKKSQGKKGYKKKTDGVQATSASSSSSNNSGSPKGSPVSKKRPSPKKVPETPSPAASIQEVPTEPPPSENETEEKGEEVTTQTVETPNPVELNLDVNKEEIVVKHEVVLEFDGSPSNNSVILEASELNCDTLFTSDLICDNSESVCDNSDFNCARSDRDHKIATLLGTLKEKRNTKTKAAVRSNTNCVNSITQLTKNANAEMGGAKPPSPEDVWRLDGPTQESLPVPPSKSPTVLNNNNILNSDAGPSTPVNLISTSST